MSETFRVRIGTQDNTREVEFTGEKLAEHRELGTKDDGTPTDTRGVTETLYRTDDDRLVLHIEDWSRWQGEPSLYSLHVVTEADLGPHGDHWAVGKKAGFGRPLTLDEAVTHTREVDKIL